MKIVVLKRIKNSTIETIGKRRKMMKKLAVKTTVAILAISLMSLVGCETVVTDVNAELNALNPKEDLGLPVKYNENYIDVAYNPSNAPKPAEDLTEDDEKNENNTDLTEDTRNDEPEDSSETIENNEADTDKEDTGSEEDTENEEDGDNEDGEEGTEGSEEDTETGDDEEDDTEENAEEDAESDLNASMAEENFDAEFYAATYPDVVAVFGDSPEALYKHYTDYGKAEGRSCNAEEFALLNESTN